MQYNVDRFQNKKIALPRTEEYWQLTVFLVQNMKNMPSKTKPVLYDNK
jgi:hypothetical protein